MAKITKKSSIIKAVGCLIFLVIGLICWLGFSKHAYPQNEYYLQQGVIYEMSGHIVKKITSGVENVTRNGNDIVVENNYVKYFGIALTCMGGVGIIINLCMLSILEAVKKE